MKIVVGIDGITEEGDLIPLVEAGADEFFVGYIPKEWSDKYGWEICPNRRQSKGCNYQSEEDLIAVCSLVHKFGKKIFFALNEHEYDSDRMVMALDMLKLAENIGFDAAIVSNLALMLEAREKGIKIPFTLSTGVGVFNSEVVEFFLRHVSGITRVILPRYLTMSEIKEISDHCREKGVLLEAFGTSDPCIFNDEYCYVWHSSDCNMFCDVLTVQKRKVAALPPIDWKNKLKDLGGKVFLENKIVSDNAIAERSEKIDLDPEEYEASGDGNTSLARVVRKCGLCALRLFSEWGIGAVKIPTRGGKNKEEIIRMVRSAAEGNFSVDECRSLIGDPKLCSGKRCSYNYPAEKI